MTISALPGELPEPTDTPDEFNSKAFTLLGAFPTLITEINAEVVVINAASTNATTKAATATTKATEAADSAVAAGASATTATNQATTATTKAGEASTSAAAALASQNSAAASAAAALGQIFAAGTRMPFAQAAAPTGWTRDVSDNADNRMLRVVSGGAGGGVGGSHSPVLNNVVPAHTHGFTTGNESNGHNHAVGDPGHQHRYSNGNNQNSNPGSGAPGYPGSGGDYTESAATGIYLGGASAPHTHSGSTDNGSSSTNWTPRYIDMIICTKS